MENLEISQVFKQMADLLEIQDANPFRVRAYRNAARVVAEYPRPLRKMVAEESDLTALPSVGKEMARHIEELVATGDLEIMAELGKDIPGVDMGKMVLHIDARSRAEARKLTGLIDFKRSLFILDDHEQRLKAMREG